MGTAHSRIHPQAIDPCQTRGSLQAAILTAGGWHEHIDPEA